MTNKEWLSRGLKLYYEIKELAKKQEEAYIKTLGVGNISTEERVQTSKKNITEINICNHLHYSEVIEEKKSELLKVKGEIVKVILEVEDFSQMQVLYEKYIRFQSIRQIAKTLGLAKSTVKRIHDKAVENIYTKYCINS